MQIAIVFRQTFISAPRNILIIKIQPNEGVHLQFNVKTQEIQMKLHKQKWTLARVVPFLAE